MNPSFIFSSSDDDEPESSSKRPTNDVFVNYSSKEIGKTFISHLRGALIRNSFTISDHTMLPVGQDMRLQLLKAIEESEMYAVVFSPDYASSERCLDELLNIMDCFKNLDERKVLPVFYKVEPSDVRSQQGPFMEPFQAHHTNTSLDPHRVLKWRQALKEAGQLSGLTLKNGDDEAKFIWEIIQELEKMQRPHELHVTDHPVGIGSRAKELISILRLDHKDCVLVVAVLGISGIGKTTVVKEVYNRVARNFDLACFLDVHSICQVPYWKAKLQKALISCLTYGNTLSIMSNHNEGVTKIKKLVSHRKVLFVLDGIDNSEQLESLGIFPEWFYEGSRIIVTTTNKGSLGYNIPYTPYKAKLLNRRESLNLFSRYMVIRDDHVNATFIKEVVRLAGGLPLVLKVWSRHFQQSEREEWPSILETLKGIPHGDVQKQLQMSYDSLTPRLQKLFLDIACFFDGMEKDLVVKVLQDEDLRYFPNTEIRYLVDRCLVEITGSGSDCDLWMHNAIREMGREIVRLENEDEPGQRTRLSDERDVMRVLTECSGTGSVESIKFVSPENMPEVTLEAFRKMNNLRFIDINVIGDDYSQGNFFCDETIHLCFKKLKYMSWNFFPFKSLDNIDMENVVVLEITSSKLETLWEGTKSLKKLRILDVSISRSLTKTADFSGLENLEELYLNECTNLEELHNSIGGLQKLAMLDLRSSMPLKRIPWQMIGKLPSLQTLCLGNDNHYDSTELEVDEVNDPLLNSLKECPIETLMLCGCNISGGVVSLPWLKNLYLSKVKFSSHCDIFLQLHALNTMHIIGCETIQSIPNLPANITSFEAHHCSNLVNLPCNISELQSLTKLDFQYCNKLGTEDPCFLMKVTGLTNLTHLTMEGCSVSQVPSEIGNLVSLTELHLSSNPFSSLPDTLSNLSQLLYLDIDDCQHLKLLPLLPSKLTNIDARSCDSLDVMSSVSLRTKVCKESPFRNRLIICLPWKGEEVPDWSNYQNGGDVLSFVAPGHLDNICGVILFANGHSNYESRITFPKMYNKTKNTSHRLVLEDQAQAIKWHNARNCMCIMYYPLDDTTFVVEAGDSVTLKFPQGSVWSCGLRLINESNVVDSELVFQNVTESYYPLKIVH